MRIKKGWPLSKIGSKEYYNKVKFLFFLIFELEIIVFNYKKISNRIKYFFSINKITKYKFNKIYPFIKDNNLKRFLLI